jgi:hypothetical protein
MLFESHARDRFGRIVLFLRRDDNQKLMFGNVIDVLREEPPPSVGSAAITEMKQKEIKYRESGEVRKLNKLYPCGQTIFFLKPGGLNLKFWDQAQKFVNCFPEILKLAIKAKRGSSFIVPVNEKIEG